MQKRPCLLVGMNVSQGDWTAGSPTSFTSACIPVLASMIMNLFSSLRRSNYNKTYPSAYLPPPS